MDWVAKILCSFLFGAMSLFSFGFAVALLKQMPLREARKVIRATFPMYYNVVIYTSLATSIVSFAINSYISLIMAGVFLSTIYARQILMPKINKATDSGNQQKFKMLHSFSVLIQLLQIGFVGHGVLIL